jgi:hypothetical protein
MRKKNLLLCFFLMTIFLSKASLCKDHNLKNELYKLGDTFGYTGSFKEVRSKTIKLKSELIPNLPKQLKIFKTIHYTKKYSGNNLLSIAKKQFHFSNDAKIISDDLVDDSIYFLQLFPDGSLNLIFSNSVNGEIDNKKLIPIKLPTENEFQAKAEKVFKKYSIDTKGYKLEEIYIGQPANEEHTLAYSVVGYYKKDVVSGINIAGFGNTIKLIFGADDNLWNLSFSLKKYYSIGEYELTPPEKAFEKVKKGECFTINYSSKYNNGILLTGELKDIKIAYVFEKKDSQDYLKPYYLFHFKSINDKTQFGTVALYPAIKKEQFDN